MSYALYGACGVAFGVQVWPRTDLAPWWWFLVVALAMDFLLWVIRRRSA